MKELLGVQLLRLALHLFSKDWIKRDLDFILSNVQHEDDEKWDVEEDYVIPPDFCEEASDEQSIENYWRVWWLINAQEMGKDQSLSHHAAFRDGWKACDFCYGEEDLEDFEEDDE